MNLGKEENQMTLLLYKPVVCKRFRFDAFVSLYGGLSPPVS